MTSYANPTYQTPTRLNQLPAASSVNSGDLLLISQNGVSKQATASQVADGGLSPSGVTAGTYGTASQVGQFTVNAQGLLTSASNVAIAIAASQVTSGQLALARGGTGADLSATGGANQFVRQSLVGGAFSVSALANADLPNSGASAATYGSGTTIPVLAVNTKGVITSATTAAVDVPGSLGTQTANTVYAGPTTGAAASPTFRALVDADIPTPMTGKTFTGSAFNGTLGATTPSTAAVTTLSASGTVTCQAALRVAPPSGDASQIFDTATVTSRQVVIRTNGSNRLVYGGSNDAESGGNAGTNWFLNVYSDAGSLLATPIQVVRSTQAVNLGGSASANALTVTPTASQNRQVTITGSNGGNPTIGVSGGSLAVSAPIVASGQISQSTTTNIFIVQSSSAGTIRGTAFQTAGSERWRAVCTADAESGADAGSNYRLQRFSDASASLGTAFYITRSNGDVSIGGDPGAESARFTTTASQNRWVTVTGSAGGNPTIGVSAGSLAISSALVLSQTTLLSTSVSLTNGAGAATGTLTNAPAAGNPTKWIPINDNGTTRYIPAW